MSKRGWLIALVSLVLLPHLTVLGTRLTSVISRGDYFETTGTERVPLYGIWKVQNGLPAYETPFDFPYAASLYNFGFYHLYGSIARVMGWSGTDLVRGSRLVTFAFALVLAGAVASVVQAAIRRGGRHADSNRSFAPASALLTVFSTGAVGWFTLSARADMASMACALVGLRLFMSATSSNGVGMMILSSGVFFLAWAFKQSTIGILGGACAVLLFGKKWRLLPALALPAAALALACVLLGTDAYRLNVVRVPSLAPFHWRGDLLRIAFVFLATPTAWLMPIAAGAERIMVRWRRLTDERNAERTLADLSIVAGGAAGWGLLALWRVGGERNSLLEPYLVLSVLSAVLIWKRWTGRSMFGAALVALAATAILPVAQLATTGFGDREVASAERHQRAALMAQRVQSLEKPVFVDEELFGEPWYATGHRHPAVLLDPILYAMLRSQGRFRESGGIEGLIASHYFGALALRGPLGFERHAMSAGYERARWLEVEGLAYKIYLRPESR